MGDTRGYRGFDRATWLKSVHTLREDNTPARGYWVRLRAAGS